MFVWIGVVVRAGGRESWAMISKSWSKLAFVRSGRGGFGKTDGESRFFFINIEYGELIQIPYSLFPYAGKNKFHVLVPGRDPLTSLKTYGWEGFVYCFRRLSFKNVLIPIYYWG